jgi:hypothetical protein
MSREMASMGLLLSVIETEVADADVVLAAFAFGGGADLDTGRRRRIHDRGHEWVFIRRKPP